MTGERKKKNPALAWNSGEGFRIDREAWLAGKKSYFLSLQLPLLVWGCYGNRGPAVGRGGGGSAVRSAD